MNQILEFTNKLIEIGANLAIILGYFLGIVGSLKILARYTKWKWDDKVLQIIEKCVKIILRLE